MDNTSITSLTSATFLPWEKHFLREGNLTGISHENWWYVLLCQSWFTDDSHFILICFSSQPSWKNILCSWQVRLFLVKKIEVLVLKTSEEIATYRACKIEVSLQFHLFFFFFFWPRFHQFKFLKGNIKIVSNSVGVFFFPFRFTAVFFCIQFLF